MIEEVRKIRIEDFDYPLPEEKIALHPLQNRDGCRLLHVDAGGKSGHHIFSELPALVKPGTLIIANETKVIRARMEFFKPTGARIEIFMLEPLQPSDYVLSFAATDKCSWSCLVGNRKRWKEEPLRKELEIPGVESPVILTVTRGKDLPGNACEVTFEWDNPDVTFATIVENAGNIPIPPYLKRNSEESDTTDYQTVYSHTEGSVAAPTAGLHFTPELIEKLREENDFATVTLHVGAGTFQPVNSEEIGDHPMHTEWISVNREVIAKIADALEEGRDILAIGTTSVRTIESLPYISVEKGVGAVTQWMPYDGKTDSMDTVERLRRLLDHLDKTGENALQTSTSIMIAPGFTWRIVNKLITNFHQPKSTLLLLVSSFLGGEWRKIYDEALARDYRFLSYGDACLFERSPNAVRLPYSKSMFMRKATLAATYHPDRLRELRKYADCEDSLNYLNALNKLLGAHEGEEVKINIGEGAAPLRFFIALAASMPGKRVVLEGSGSLPRRPLAPLVDILKRMGADIEYDGAAGMLPLRINGKKLQGGKIEVDTSVTSQFLSALLLASRLWEGESEFVYDAETAVSNTYLQMTEDFIKNPDRKIEPDWSSAAFFYELLLVSAMRTDTRLPAYIEIEQLTPPSESIQGDALCSLIFRDLGIDTEYRKDGSARLSITEESTKRLELLPQPLRLNLKDTPDLVPPLAVALAFCGIKFEITGIRHIRYKESDRLEALKRGLHQLGYDVELTDDSIGFNGKRIPAAKESELDCGNDHRIVMAFAPLIWLDPSKKLIRDEGHGKSFPNFWQYTHLVKSGRES